MQQLNRLTAETESSLDPLLRQWDGEEVIVRFDRPSASWIVIAIHSTQWGPAAGGTRMKTYPDLQAAVKDALRLAEGMTAKLAVARFPWGGGKAVIAVPAGLEAQARQGLLLRYGRLVRQLGGLYLAGQDVGMSTADMDVVAETGAPYIVCRSPQAGGSGDSGPPTALGVFHGIRVTVDWLFGGDALAGKRVLVQGAGSVGGPLLGQLAEAGAAVLVSDVDREAVRRAEQRFGAQVVHPDLVYDTPCDIFAPCALGGILNRETIPRLSCRAIVGSANNQLETSQDAESLRERGILYAPDFVVNVGGTIAILGIDVNGWSREEAERRIVETVTQTLRQIFDLAAAEDTTTVAAAERIVAELRGQMEPV